MEPWRTHLESAFATLNKKTSRTIEAVSDSLKAAMSSFECEHCQIKCFEADMLALPCGHHHCNDCLTDQLERSVGYLERNYPAKQFKEEGILICSKCHEVCAVKRKTVFSGVLHSKDREALGRVVFEVNRTLTEQLRKGSEVKKCYENQRRTLLGRFNSASLMPFERNAFSKWDPTTRDDSKVPVDMIAESGRYTSKELDANVRDAGKIWIEDWTFDKSCGDPQGWQYAFNWPQSDEKWKLEPSASTFVRRRLLVRACIPKSALEASN